jgi:TRAP-type C4-dicarboxylate transport system permease small subunit
MMIWKLWDIVLDILAGLSAIVIAVMAFGICYDILLRSLDIRGGAVWVFDFVEYGVLFVTCAMAAYISRAGRHVEVDLLLLSVSDRVAWALRILSAFMVTAISGLLFYYALRGTIQSFEHGSFIFRAILIPEWIPFAAVTVMFLSVGIEGLRRVHTQIVATDGRADAPSESSF